MKKNRSKGVCVVERKDVQECDVNSGEASSVMFSVFNLLCHRLREGLWRLVRWDKGIGYWFDGFGYCVTGLF